MTNHHYIGNDNSLRDILPALPYATVSHAHFASTESLCEYVEGLKPSTLWNSESWDNDISFRGTRSMKEAIALCRAGWPEGAKRAAELRDKIAAASPIAKQLARWDVGGAYPSVPRALAGNPMHMRRIDSAVTRRKPIMTLIHHMGGRSHVAAATFANKAAVVAAIVDSIESANYQVELIAVSASNQDSFCHETAFVVKQAGQALDIGRLAFSIGHPSAFRRFVFACRCGIEFNRPLRPSLGQTVDYKNPPIEGAYILPSVNECEKYFALETLAATRGLQWFIDKLSAQGCPAFPQSQAA